MQHNTLPSDIRPGEELLANRIRMTLPATVRDRMLPPADADLVRDVRAKHGTCDQETAYIYVRTIVIACIEEMEITECELTGRRIRTFFAKETSLFTVRK